MFHFTLHLSGYALQLLETPQYLLGTSDCSPISSPHLFCYLMDPQNQLIGLTIGAFYTTRRRGNLCNPFLDLCQGAARTLSLDSDGLRQLANLPSHHHKPFTESLA
jgi:hypothetical protein